MKHFPHRKPPEHEDEGWLITFADMAVLLMSFFILMWALSSPQSKDLMERFSSSLHERGFHNDAYPETESTETLKKQLSLAVGEKGYDQFIAASENLHGVDVELAASAFFESGSAKFAPDALPMLQLIAQQIMPFANDDVTIEVVGHTDDSPINSSQFPSNWELSSARASNVVRYFIAQQFPAKKLRSVGAADTDPKAANRDAQGNALPANQNINRRVVIRIIRGDDN